MNDRSGVGHPLDSIPEYVNGRLDGLESAAVRAHLQSCDDCRNELVAWQAVASAAVVVSTGSAGVPSKLAARVAAAVARDVADVSRPDRRSAAERGRWLGHFVWSQAPLVRREIWPASTVVMFIGVALSLIARNGGAGLPGTALSLLAPLAAAVGIAMIYGEENDPALELTLATPTSPRLVVVARLFLVLAWDLALALAASAVLAIIDGPAVFLPIVSTWLGPMLLLGCLVLLLSLFVQASAAIGVAMALWTLRAVTVTSAPRLADLAPLNDALNALWQTSPLTIALSLVLLVSAVIVTPYRESLNARPSI